MLHIGPWKLLSWNLKEVCSCLLLTSISLNGTIIYDTEIMNVKDKFLGEDLLSSSVEGFNVSVFSLTILCCSWSKDS
jgi:hypothetical protein